MSQQIGGEPLGNTQEYYQSQYRDARNVLARFAMYSLELCNEGENPFDQELEIVTGFYGLELSLDATILDMGTSDAHFIDYLNVSGFRGKLIGSDPNSDQYRKMVLRDSSVAATERRKQLAWLVFADLPNESIESLILYDDYTDTNVHKLLIRANANNVPIRDKTVDAYVANNMLYHLTDIDGALIEAKNTLTSNGKFVASTSGKFNKHEHREDEVYINRRIAEITDSVSLPPLKMNDGFTTEKARFMLPKHFNHVYLLNHDGVLLVRDELSKSIYRNSLYSMYDQFDPLPDRELFESLVDEVISNIGEEGKLIRVSRSVAFCSDTELEGLDMQRYEKLEKAV